MDEDKYKPTKMKKGTPFIKIKLDKKISDNYINCILIKINRS